MTHFRHAAIALLAGATAANAQTTVITREPVETRTVVTTDEPLRLTPVQRQTIYRTVVRERAIPSERVIQSERVAPAEPTVEYRVGTRVPRGAQLYSVPETVAVEVPTIKRYKYMMVNNRVVLVDPATSEVVDEFAD